MLTSLQRKLEASMTVEAAVVLPLFLFFFLNLGSAIEMIRLHGNLELALWEVGNRISVYGHALGGENSAQDTAGEVIESGNDETDSWWMEMSGIALSYTYVKSQILEYLGKDYLESSPLTYGIDGLQFLESNIWETDGRFEIVLTYSVSPVSSVSGFRSFRMANRYYGHLWNGYHIPGTKNGERAEQYVYVTENGEVYHTDRSCTHLTLSIQEVSLAEAYQSRNEQGARYKDCEKCNGLAYRGSVYITNQGDCFHFEKDCPGLKRTVEYVPLSKVKDKRLCTRCAQ